MLLEDLRSKIEKKKRKKKNETLDPLKVALRPSGVLLIFSVGPSPLVLVSISVDKSSCFSVFRLKRRTHGAQSVISGKRGHNHTNIMWSTWFINHRNTQGEDLLKTNGFLSPCVCKCVALRHTAGVDCLPSRSHNVEALSLCDHETHTPTEKDAGNFCLGGRMQEILAQHSPPLLHRVLHLPQLLILISC